MMTYGEGFDCPHNNILIGCVFTTTSCCFKLGGIGVWWNGNQNLYVVGSRSSFKLTLSFDHVLDTTVLVTFYHRFYPNQRFYLENKTVFK